MYLTIVDVHVMLHFYCTKVINSYTRLCFTLITILMMMSKFEGFIN